MAQDNLFFEGEGDAWFRRNRMALNSKDKYKSNDYPSRAITWICSDQKLGSVLELGCSNGARLAFLKGELGDGIKFVGVDASLEAIEEGKLNFPNLELHHGLLNHVPLEASFDCVIVNFVLHWVDRAMLARSVAEIDRLVKEGGFLILGDFAVDFPQRRRYHHRQDAEVYTYKQDYSAIFKAMGSYSTLQRLTYNYDNPSLATLPLDGSNRAFCEIMTKSSRGLYPDIES